MSRSYRKFDKDKKVRDLRKGKRTRASQKQSLKNWNPDAPQQRSDQKYEQN